MVFLVYLSFAIPLLLCFLLATLPFANRLTWILMSLFAFSSTLFTCLAPIESWVSSAWLYLLWISFGASFAFSFWRHHKKNNWPTKKFTSWIAPVVLSVLAISQLKSLPHIFTGRNYDARQSVSLQFPLKGGTFLIIHGGANTLVNYHYAYEAQKYALDIAQINETGKKAKVFPSEIHEDYFIYGSEVISPCDGEVIYTQDGLPDKIPLSLPNEAKNPAGNHIVIFCKNVSVTLAHLKPKSIFVQVGDQLKTGQTIAKAGNTGNTSEPHLHVHAVQGRTTDPKVLMATGLAVPVVYNEKFLIRGDTITQ